MITYMEYPNKLAKWGLGVFVDHMLTGYIEEAPKGGYRYAVKGAQPANKYGETFATVEEVKTSLEATEAMT